MSLRNVPSLTITANTNTLTTIKNNYMPIIYVKSSSNTLSPLSPFKSPIPKINKNTIRSEPKLSLKHEYISKDIIFSPTTGLLIKKDGTIPKSI